MKKICSVLLLLGVVILANAQLSKDQVIAKFVDGVISVEGAEISEYTPISSFNKLAGAQAAKVIILTKENVTASLTEAKDYSACFISVGTHTVVKITDFTKSLMSGSWGVQMPFGTGYVQKGELVEKQDYINNIIGIPDTQRRMMFLFE